MGYHNNAINELPIKNKSEDKIIQELDPIFIKEFLEKIRCHNPLEKWSDEMTPKQIYNFTFLKKYGIISVKGFNVVDNKITV